ncbi:hypothetical protein, conserved [Eimeria necatrix]|uniref:Cilia- and flagella-associated protein 206 n=1 Tax=Eimeria necatrix TaxID=51315 RepID=U6MHX3_9EIME|nr:hypothetical protein, conserved [Eimeria necatrix]CDJ62668.1 hypothetical protein, conserved [Eimeria necatrix]
MAQRAQEAQMLLPLGGPAAAAAGGAAAAAAGAAAAASPDDAAERNEAESEVYRQRKALDSNFMKHFLPQLAQQVVAAARTEGVAVSLALAAYLLLTLPPAAAPAAEAAAPPADRTNQKPPKATAAAAAAEQCIQPFRFSLAATQAPSHTEAEAAVAAAVRLLQQRSTDPVAATLALQVSFEALLLDTVAAAALQQIQEAKGVEDAAALVVHADHSQLRRTAFVCLLRQQLLSYCVAALPMVAAVAIPEEAAAAAAARAPLESAAAAAAAAAEKAAAVRRLVEQALDAALPITRLPCLYSLPPDLRRQHLEELRCIVIASLLLQQRRAAAAAAATAAAAAKASAAAAPATASAAAKARAKAAAEAKAEAAAKAAAIVESFDWLEPPEQAADDFAAEQQQLLLQQAVKGQDALQRVRNIFRVDEKLAKFIAAESVFHVQQIRFLQALLVQQQQQHSAAAAQAAVCLQELASVESYLREHKGKAPPEVVYSHLAAAGAAYLGIYKEQQGLLQLSALRLLLQKHAEALQAPDITKVDAAALRLRRRAPPEKLDEPLPYNPPSSSSSSSSSSMRVLTAADTEMQKPAELGGYCLQTLLEEGALVSGDIHAGGIELNGEIYLFSSRRRLREFLEQQRQLQQQQPQVQQHELLLQQLTGVMRHNPALIFALGLEKRFPEPNLKALLAWAYHQELQELQTRLQQRQTQEGQQQEQQQQEQQLWEADWEYRPELYVRISEGKAADAAVDTADLLQLTAELRSSKSSSSSYSYDEWELRRRVLQQVRLCACASRSMQTLLSTFKRDAESQTIEKKETATNTAVAAATGGPHSSRSFVGLRGADATANKPLREVVLRVNF